MRLLGRRRRRAWASTAAASRSDAGMVGGVEALPFGLLVFVVGTLLIVNCWAVVDAKLAVDAAARQATRTYVESDGGDDAEQRAVDAGLAALAAHGRDPAEAAVGLSGTRAPAAGRASRGAPGRRSPPRTRCRR